MLQARQLIRPERFAFHSSRMRMNEVSKDELASLDGESDRCALELLTKLIVDYIANEGYDVLDYVARDPS